MPDNLFEDADLAALYDLFSPFEGRGDFSLYLPMVMSAQSVLDIGCGTGALLHRARRDGHTGRLCGLDPAVGMLKQARKQLTKPGIEWVLGDLGSVSWQREFDLIVMSGHAFQVFVEDDELRTALTAIRSALTPSGKFAFETRNPLDRAWERWGDEYSREVTTSHGEIVRMSTEVQEADVDGETATEASGLVRFSHTFTSSRWSEPRTSHSTLRFLDLQSLSSFLDEAGLVIEQQFGDWDRSPVTGTSPEIITIARLALT